MENSFVERVDLFAKEQPNSIAITAQGQSLSYQAFSTTAKRLATFLLKTGVKKGDKVLCRGAQCLQFLVLYSALLRIGAVLVAVEHDCPKSFIRELKTEFDIKVFFGDEKEENLGMPLLYLDKIMEYAAQEESFDGVNKDYASEAQILFTTGSTGKRKGVLIPVSRACEGKTIGRITGYKQSTVCYLFAPVNHMAFFGFASAVLYYGGELIVAQGMIQLKDFLYALEERKANAIHATPSVFNFWMERCGELLQDFSAQIKTISMTGEKTPQKTVEGLKRIYKNTKICTVYGSTETGVITGRDLAETSGAVGYVGDLQKEIDVQIIDGKIAVSSPYLMIGYTDGKERNIGRVLTDDRGRVEGEKIYVDGRVSDVIICGGHKIDPLEVENAVNDFELVEGCVCAVTSDMVLGNALKLYVHWKKNVALDEQERKVRLRKYLTANLESYKIPSVLQSVTEIRKNTNGKTDRKYYNMIKE